MQTRVAIIGSNGLPGNYGGWDQLVNHLTLKLGNRFSFLVYTSYYNAVKGVTEYNGATLRIIWLKANGIQSIFYDMISLFHAVTKCDILLVLGTSGCVFFPIIKLFNKKIILNPDGIEWKRKKWNKFSRWFLKLSEKVGIQHSNIVIADNKIIKKYIKETYKIEPELIEYGGDHASHVPMCAETKSKYSLETNNYAFKVCRIEPENNIHLILDAFKDSKITVVIVGNWNYSKYGRKLRNKYGAYRNYRLLDPIYEQERLNELRSNCCFYIHGHSVGGTNPSLVEAMNLGLCVVAFNIEYNIETTENCAIYFNSVSDLANILNEYDNDKIDIVSYKEKMNEIAKRRYTWGLITEKYASVFLK